ncbi:MAG: SDR family oxidoreductase [Hyphomicrobiaceae bacterium]|nr:SDR family oxidoreductase [Hyphomicrobiaceae bacterium]
MDLELKGKVAIVTGGSRGIGKAVGRALAAEGCDVALVSRSLATLEPAVQDIAAPGGGRVQGFACDTSEDASVKAMVEAVAKAFGRIDILVNCAAKPSGQARPPSLAEITTEEFWDHMNTKVMGYLRTAREVAPHMIRQKAGRIINVSGLGARRTGTTIGSIRNVGVAALTKNIADELGPKGITAVCVHPGLTRTEATAGVVAARAKAKGISEAAAEQELAATNVIKTLISAEQIAHVCTFLASPKSIAINGETIGAGGGMPDAIFY